MVSAGGVDTDTVNSTKWVVRIDLFTKFHLKEGILCQ